jgi:hypothetical protein
MSIADQIDQLRGYPSEASDAFRGQLERARLCREQMDGQIPPVKGIDRSGELVPLPRPTILRSAC